MYIMKGRTKGSIGKILLEHIATIYFLVERYNRTIKTRIQRQITETKSKTWINSLDQMTKNLNATVNRSIGMAPRDVTFENVLYNQKFSFLLLLTGIILHDIFCFFKKCLQTNYDPSTVKAV